MPLAKICNAPGCKVINHDGAARCPKHKTTRRRRNITLTPEAKERSKFYNTQRWRKLSKMIRTMRPLCEVCESQGFVVPGYNVDHVIEIQDNEALKYDWRNLQHLCYSCHQEKTRAVERARNAGNLDQFYTRYNIEREARKRLDDYTDAV